MFGLHANKVYTGEGLLEDSVVLFQDGKIHSFVKPKTLPKGVRVFNYSKDILVPGFIDIQINGGAGVLFNDSIQRESLKTISKAHLNYGTTSFLPTLITSHKSDLIESIECVNTVFKTDMSEDDTILGLHLEGPFLNMTKKGIHNEKHMRALEGEDLKILKMLNSPVKLITLAPEVNDLKSVKQLQDIGFKVFCGHSNASYEDLMPFVEKKALHGVTHIFNACSQIKARDPGVVGAGLLEDSLYVSLIADGHHIHNRLLDLLFKIKNLKKILLVSDAMPPSCSKVKKPFKLNGEDIFVKDGRCVNSKGVLSGAALSLLECLQYLNKNFSMNLEDSLRMTSSNQADALGLKDRGYLKSGYSADFVVLSKTLALKAVFKKGNLI